MAADYDTQIAVTLIDKASKEYEAVGKKLVEENKKIDASSKGVAKALKGEEDAAKGVGKEVENLSKLTSSAASKTNGYTSAVSAASKTTAEATPKINSLAASVKGLVGAYLGMQGIRMAKQFLSDSAKEAVVAEQAYIRLGAVLRATGKDSEISAEQVSGMAKHLQEITVFEDDAIISAQALLLEFDRIGADTLPRATKAMLDLASRTGDMQGSAILLGKALQGEEGSLIALRRAGIVFNDEQEKMMIRLRESGKFAEANAIIFEKLEGRIGGSAEAAGKSASGEYLKMQNRFKDIEEQIGQRTLPYINRMGSAFLKTWNLITGEVGAGQVDVFNLDKDEILQAKALITDVKIAQDELNKSMAAKKGVDAFEARSETLFYAKETLAAYLGIKDVKIAEAKVQERINQLNQQSVPITYAGTKSDETIAAEKKEFDDRQKAAEKAFDMMNNKEIAFQIMLSEGRKKGEEEMAQADADATQKRIENVDARIKKSEEEIKAYEDLNAKIKETQDAYVQSFDVKASLVSASADLGKAMLGDEKKYAIARKTIAISEATINGTLAVMKIWAQGGMFAAPMAIAMGMTTAANVLKISNQKFAQGGFVQGTSTSGDREWVRANAGEGIITTGQQRRLMDILDGRASVGASPISFSPVITIYGATDANATAAAVQKTTQELVRDFSRMQRRTQTAMV